MTTPPAPPPSVSLKSRPAFRYISSRVPPQVQDRGV
jgi:hypothetical protein